MIRPAIPACFRGAGVAADAARRAAARTVPLRVRGQLDGRRGPGGQVPDQALGRRRPLPAGKGLRAHHRPGHRRDPAPWSPAPWSRFERFWTQVIDSFQASSQVWLATFDIVTVAQRDPEVRAAVAEGLEDGRKLWARLLYGVDDADEEKTRAIGSLHQALVSGVLVQWLIDPDRAPSAADLARGLHAIAGQVAPAS
jgi:hypothetical protein